MRPTFALALALACALAPDARAQAVRSDLVLTNGQVNAELIQDGKLYLGGSFTNVGPRTGAGVPVDSLLGGVVSGFPEVDGVVNAVVSDSAGGWFVGGTFTSVGGQPRNNLAHVLADLSVAPWDPSPNQPVFALAYRVGVLYAGGDFSTIGGETRGHIAAIDPASGLATAWDPGANATVRALSATDSVVYAGGSFSTAGGQSRSRLAALDRVSGDASPWNPGSNGTVFAIDAGGGIVYAGGFFSIVGGQSRVDLAAVDAATGSTTAWNPKPDNQVLALQLKGDRVYVGGAFTKFGLATFRGAHRGNRCRDRKSRCRLESGRQLERARAVEQRPAGVRRRRFHHHGRAGAHVRRGDRFGQRKRHVLEPERLRLGLRVEPGSGRDLRRQAISTASAAPYAGTSRRPTWRAAHSRRGRRIPTGRCSRCWRAARP